MKNNLIILLMLFCGTNAFSQQTNKQKATNKKEEKRKKIDALIKQEEEGVIAYKKHFAYGAKLTSDGFGGFLEKGKANSIRKASLYQFEIGERKHQKESSVPAFINGGASFIYGKINYVYPVKLGMQQQYLLGNKTNKNGVAITANYGGGIALALLRPYELEVEKNGQPVFVRYESADSSLFINGPIISGPTIGKGWNGLKLTPGAYAKAALRFDYGKYNEILTGLEAGITAEYYSKKIPQMVYNKQQSFFFNAYIALVFGKRK